MNERKKIFRAIPLMSGGIYFLIANAMFFASSELPFYSLLLVTFPYGPICMDALHYLDVTYFVNYGDDVREKAWNITSYLMLVVGGMVWYWFLTKCFCWWIARFLKSKGSVKAPE